MNKNVKLRSRRTKAAVLSSTAAQQPSRPQIKRLENHSKKLGEEIHRLECTIAAAPHAQRRRQLAYIDTLPPPEPLRSPVRKPKRLPIQQRRQRRVKSAVLVVEFLIVAAALAACVGLLNHWFGLW